MRKKAEPSHHSLSLFVNLSLTCTQEENSKSDHVYVFRDGSELSCLRQLQFYLCTEFFKATDQNLVSSGFAEASFRVLSIFFFYIIFLKNVF